MTKFDVGLLKKEISKEFLSYFFLYPVTVWYEMKNGLIAMVVNTII